MPASTPIYSFPYPCPGEVVSASSFMNLANAIDAKMQDVVLDENYALNRYSFRVGSAAQNAVNNVPLVTSGTDSTIVLPVAGLWLVSAKFTAANFATPGLSLRLRVQQNGVSRFGEMEKPATGFLAEQLMTTSGIILSAAGDVLGTEVLETAVNFQYIVILEAKLIIRIA